MVMDPQPVRLPSPQNIRGLYLVEYDKLVDLGVFEDQSVELLDGQVVEMSPQGDAHDTIVRRLQRALIHALPRDLEVNAHSGFPIAPRSKPEPDITVFPGQARFHQAAGVMLVIEVSVSSLHNDRDIKAAIYASSNAPEYWVVDVAHDKIIVHTRPGERGYEKIETFGRGAILAPVALTGFSITVDDVLDAPL